MTSLGKAFIAFKNCLIKERTMNRNKSIAYINMHRRFRLTIK